MSKPRRPTPKRRARPDPLPSWRGLALSAGLLAIGLVAFLSVRDAGFLAWDDAVYVTRNPHVLDGLTWRGVTWAFTSVLATNWHPVTWLSHMLDVQLFGVNPGAHHLVNLALHLTNTLLLFGVLSRMTGALGRSAFVAALFAVHPLHVESVAWIAERKDVLSTLFWLLTMWAYVTWARRPSALHMVGVLLPMALGLMAKPMLVTLPWVLLLLDAWPLGRWFEHGERGREGSALAALARRVAEKLPLFALAAAASAITLLVQRRGGAVSGAAALPLGLRLANPFVSYLAYIGKLAWPARLSPLYPYREALPVWQWGGAVLLLAIATYAALRSARSRPYVAVGWLWYLGTLAPVIGFIQVGVQSMADRYTYVPSIGLFVMLSWGVPELLPRARLLPALAVIAIVACTLVAHRQVQYWRDGITLWTHALAVTSRNPAANENLGFELQVAGRTEAAAAQYRETLRAWPGYPPAHLRLARTLARLGKPDEAIGEYRATLALTPGDAAAHNELGLALAARGRLAEAVAEYSRATGLRPEFADAHFDRGVALASLGRNDEAAAEYAETLRLEPGRAEAHNNLGVILANGGHVRDAAAHFAEAVRLRPDFANARNNLDYARELLQQRH